MLWWKTILSVTCNVNGSVEFVCHSFKHFSTYSERFISKDTHPKEKFSIEKI